MAVIAKGSITLTSVSDAWSVSLQPSNVVINADPYGGNPNLTNANTAITLFCGSQPAEIDSIEIVGSSLWIEGMTAAEKADTEVKLEGGKYRLTILKTGSSLDGWRDIEVRSKQGKAFKARFTYTVVREPSTLDWVMEWDKNYTEIGKDHIATPNILIGSKNAAGKLSGTYIGADMPDHSAGIYAFKDCPDEAFRNGNIEQTEIFHLNGEGGMIGGWNISGQGIWADSEDGRFEILSEGSLKFSDYIESSWRTVWEFKPDGSGSLACGHIGWDKEGSAHFTGSIQAQSGIVGGWSIGERALYSSNVFMGSDCIGIHNGTNNTAGCTSEDVRNEMKTKGGVAMFYDSLQSYGIQGWTQKTGSDATGKMTFALGSTNVIAGWKFDATSLFIGNKNNMSGQFSDNGITLGTNGLRGKSWRIESDGNTVFADGKVAFNNDGSGKLAGGKIIWDLNGNMAFDPSVKFTWDNITDAESVIGKLTKIDANGIYTGEIAADKITSGTIQSASIKSEGKWALNHGGDGYLASGNISWDAGGSLHVKGLLSQELKDITNSDAETTILINEPGRVSEYTLKKDLYLIIKDAYPNSTPLRPIQTPTVVLPTSEDYRGREVKLYQIAYDSIVQYNSKGVLVKPDDGTIIGLPIRDEAANGGYDAVYLKGGFMEFVGLPRHVMVLNEEEGTQNRTQWFVSNFHGESIIAVKNGVEYEI